MRNMSHAWDNLVRVTRILKRARIPYVLDGGTLLGMYRDGWFFPHDQDIDLTLLDQHAKLARVRKNATKQGFRVWRHQPVGSCGCHKLQLSRHGIMVDIVSKHREGDDAVWALITDAQRMKRMPARYYTELGSLVVRDVAFSVPADVEGYLAARFGSDWRTPKPDWVPLRDDRAYEEVP